MLRWGYCVVFLSVGCKYNEFSKENAPVNQRRFAEA